MSSVHLKNSIINAYKVEYKMDTPRYPITEEDLDKWSDTYLSVFNEYISRIRMSHGHSGAFLNTLKEVILQLPEVESECKGLLKTLSFKPYHEMCKILLYAHKSQLPLYRINEICENLFTTQDFVKLGEILLNNPELAKDLTWYNYREVIFNELGIRDSDVPHECKDLPLNLVTHLSRLYLISREAYTSALEQLTKYNTETLKIWLDVVVNNLNLYPLDYMALIPYITTSTKIDTKLLFLCYCVKQYPEFATADTFNNDFKTIFRKFIEYIGLEIEPLLHIYGDSLLNSPVLKILSVCQFLELEQLHKIKALCYLKKDTMPDTTTNYLFDEFMEVIASGEDMVNYTSLGLTMSEFGTLLSTLPKNKKLYNSLKTHKAILKLEYMQRMLPTRL